jgi:hypothetical protein
MAKRILPAVFAFAIVCFFFPWLTVNCAGSEFVTLSGVQLATGTTIESPSLMGETESDRTDPEILAAVAIFLGVIGLVLSLVKGRSGNVGALITGILGVLALLGLSAKINSDIAREGEGMLQAEFRFGYFMTLLLFAAATVVKFIPGLNEERTAVPGAQSSGDQFCTQCGLRILKGDQFCKNCGTKVI